MFLREYGFKRYSMIRTIINSILVSFFVIGLVGTSFAEDDRQQKILELKHQIIELQNAGELGASFIFYLTIACKFR